MTYRFTEVKVLQQCAEAGAPLADLQLTEGQAVLVTVTDGQQTISTLSATDPGISGLTLTQVAQHPEGT